jgi:hypothetical protein
MLEALVRHDMIPVAGVVADAEEDRLVLRFGARQRFVAPGVPIDRVVPVLEQIGAGFVRQAVHGVSFTLPSP